MIYCITLIIIVTLVCVTRLYPLWVERNRMKVEKAMELVAKVREENNCLRKELDTTYNEWFKDLSQKEKVIREIFDNLYELTEKVKEYGYDKEKI